MNGDPFSYSFYTHDNSGVIGGGQSTPQRPVTGKFLLTCWEKRDKEKMEKGGNRKKEGEL